MASSPESVEFSGKKTAANSSEKSSFSQTCSLLSQYLKEKGSLGDLSLGIACNLEANGNGTTEMLRQTATTMNLFPVAEKQISPCNFRSMDVLPQFTGFVPSAPKEDVQNKIDSRPATPEPQNAQMTIFYAGQVLVFNDFPADKAKEIMLLASKGRSQSYSTVASVPANNHPAFVPLVAKTAAESVDSVPPSPNQIPAFSNNLVQERIKHPTQPMACDLPLARRASLHRFLEKRKDRIIARAPYQMSNQSACPPSKPAESKSWLSLAAQSPQKLNH